MADQPFPKGIVSQMWHMQKYLQDSGMDMSALSSHFSSCSTWAQIVAEIFGGLENLVGKAGIDFPQVLKELEKRNPAYISMKQPGHGDHHFWLVPQDDGKIVVVGAWQDQHRFKVTSKPMKPSDAMLALRKVSSPTSTAAERGQQLELLFGWQQGFAPDAAVEIPSTFTVKEGQRVDLHKSWKQLGFRGDGVAPKQGEEVYRFTATIGQDDLVPEVQARARQGQPGPSVGSQALLGGAWGAGLGFIVAMGDVTINGSRGKTTGQLVEGVVVPTAMGFGAGAMGGAMDAAIVAPALAKGMSGAAAGAMYGIGAAVGAATLLVSSLWDVSKRARGQITGVEQRKSFSSTVGGAVGGVGVGVTATVATLALATNPVGWVVGAIGITAGLVGGVGGSLLGGIIDGAIFDATEDQIMHAYEFFFCQHPGRGERPSLDSDQVERAYQNRITHNSSDPTWVKSCNALLLCLVNAYFPNFQKLIRHGEELRGMPVALRELTAEALLSGA